MAANSTLIDPRLIQIMMAPYMASASPWDVQGALGGLVPYHGNPQVAPGDVRGLAMLGMGDQSSPMSSAAAQFFAELQRRMASPEFVANDPRSATPWFNQIGQQAKSDAEKRKAKK